MPNVRNFTLEALREDLERVRGQLNAATQCGDTADAETFRDRIEEIRRAIEKSEKLNKGQ